MLLKQFIKKDTVCRVTFRVPKKLAKENSADSVSVVGDFNNWNPKANDLEALKDGQFKLVMDLEAGKSYQFRYLANGHTWFNDDKAETVPNEFGGLNSVVEATK